MYRNISSADASLRLIGPRAMVGVDARTIAGGTSGMTLMERAGDAVVRAIRSNWPRRPVVILAGPGQNGGDGWVIARRLRALGWPVSLHSDWPIETLSGDAREAADRFAEAPTGLGAFTPDRHTLVIDALFGAGLSRPIEGSPAAALCRARDAGCPVVGVDLPSGLHGMTGEILGIVAPADLTVTFGAAKPGHWLGEGHGVTGRLLVADIGLDMRDEDAGYLRNDPALWRNALPLPPGAPHKYARGAALIVGGPRHAGGAARLVAEACARTGAGATTLAASPGAADLYAGRFDSIMVTKYAAPDDLAGIAGGEKIAAFGIGPGLGTDAGAADRLEAVLSTGKPAVLDADALTLLAARDEPFADLPEACVLTPHEGEFARLFGDLEGDAGSRAVRAAERCGRTVILKGATSVIAAPGRTPVLNVGGSPYLATAGSGDSLTGITLGWLAQGAGAFNAACAASYLHAEAGRRFGPGLTADDISGLIPGILADWEGEWRSRKDSNLRPTD